MRITKRSNLALRVLMFCAINAKRLVTKHDIARMCNSSENHLGQIVNKLSQMGLLSTSRGRGGGIRLAVAPEEIRVGDVFRSFESDLPLAECFAEGESTCPLISGCRLRHAISAAVEAFYDHLDQMTLDNLIDGNHALESVLCLDQVLGCKQSG